MFSSLATTLSPIEQGRLRLTVPTVIAPRYGDPRESGMQPHQAPEHSLFVEYAFDIELAIDPLPAAATLSSPSHDIAVERSDNAARVRLSQQAYLDRDFVLLVEGMASGPAAAVLAADGDTYVAMVSFCSPLTEDVASLQPRALKLLVDCSGSMEGDSIEVAKRALHEVISRLRPEDRFSLTRFGSRHEHVFRKLQPAQGRYLEKAREALASMGADLHGTEMESALVETYQLKGPTEAADILLITDGEIHATESLITQAKRHGQRVFAVGVGSAPAEGFLRELAIATGGAAEFVSPGDDVEAATIRMMGRMRSPQAGDIAIAWPSEPLWTAGVPQALYAGDTVHVYAGFRNTPVGEALLTFTTLGDQKHHGLAARVPLDVLASDTLPRVAAAERLRDGVGEDAAVALAVRYQLVTSRTNFLVVHERAEAEKAAALPALAAQAQMLAAGWGGTGAVCARRSGVAMSLSVPRQRLPACSRSEDIFEMLDIPAFLREKVSSTPAALERRAPGKLNPRDFAETMAWDLAQGAGALPVDIAALYDAGLPAEVCRELLRLAEMGIEEELVVQAFLAALLEHSAVAEQFGRHLQREVARRQESARYAPELQSLMARVARQCTPDTWPDRGAWRSAYGVLFCAEN